MVWAFTYDDSQDRFRIRREDDAPSAAVTEIRGGDPARLARHARRLDPEAVFQLDERCERFRSLLLPNS